MDNFAGLEASVNETSICFEDTQQDRWEVKVSRGQS